MRVDMDMKQAEMAKKLGITTSFLSSIELGQKPLPEKLVDGLLSFATNQADRDELKLLASSAKCWAKQINSMSSAHQQIISDLIYVLKSGNAEIEKIKSAVWGNK